MLAYGLWHIFINLWIGHHHLLLMPSKWQRINDFHNDKQSTWLGGVRYNWNFLLQPKPIRYLILTWDTMNFETIFDDLKKCKTKRRTFFQIYIYLLWMIIQRMSIIYILDISLVYYNIHGIKTINFITRDCCHT